MGRRKGFATCFSKSKACAQVDSGTLCGQRSIWPFAAHRVQETGEKSAMRPPKLSVVMSVYNGERYVEDAVNSILNQTFCDFEFIIINDGSTDRTAQILAEFDDPRIKVINQPNRGLTASLNRGIRLAKGKYIARMDADDFSEPQRLERQIEIIDQNPDIALVTCWYKVSDEKGDVLACQRLPTESEQLAELLVHDNPMCHGSVLIRKEAIEAVGLYSESLRYAQDYELWLRMLRRNHKLCVVPEFLYRFRISPDSVAKLYIQRRYAALIRKTQGDRHVPTSSRRIEKLGTLNQRRKHSLYHYAIGTLELENGQVKGARRELLKSIRMDPINLRPWYRLALSSLPAWMGGLVSSNVKRSRDLLLWLRWR